MSNNRGRNSTQKKKIKIRLFGGRASYPCCFCGRILVLTTATLEHVMPLSMGGGWHITNLRLSCRPCNSERGNEDFWEFKNRKRDYGGIISINNQVNQVQAS